MSLNVTPSISTSLLVTMMATLPVMTPGPFSVIGLFSLRSVSLAKDLVSLLRWSVVPYPRPSIRACVRLPVPGSRTCMGRKKTLTWSLLTLVASSLGGFVSPTFE